jgi:hypothetical protein
VWVLGAALISAASPGWLASLASIPYHNRLEAWSLEARSVASFGVIVGTTVLSVLGRRLRFVRLLWITFGILGGTVFLGGIGLSFMKIADVATLLLFSGLVGVGFGAALVLLLRALNQVSPAPNIAATSALVVRGITLGAIVGTVIPGLLVYLFGDTILLTLFLALLGLAVIVAGVLIARAMSQGSDPPPEPQSP